MSFKKLTLAALTCCLLLLPTVQADEPSPQRIAVLDLQAALLGTPSIRAAFEQIDNELNEEAAPLRQLAEEGRALEQRLERDGAIMSTEERNNLVQELEQKLQQYQQGNLRLQQQQQQRQQAIIEANQERLEAAVNTLLEEHQIDILLQRQAVHFARPAFDLTPLVSQALEAAE